MKKILLTLFVFASLFASAQPTQTQKMSDWTTLIPTRSNLAGTYSGGIVFLNNSFSNRKFANEYFMLLEDSTLYYTSRAQYKKGMDSLKLIIDGINASFANYYTKTQADALYQPLGSYASASHNHDGVYQPAGSYVPQTRTITINGVSYDLSQNRSWTIAGGTGGSVDTTVMATWKRLYKVVDSLSAAGWASGGGGGASTVKQTHTAGASVTAGNETTWLVVNPASTLSSLTITLAAIPSDGQLLEISFGGTITSGDVITALTVAANTGHSLLQATTPTSPEAGETLRYRFNSTNSKWYRL